MKKYKLLKDPQNARYCKAGDTVYEFTGNDFGSVRNDFCHKGLDTVSVVAHTDRDAPFFTVPREDLQEIEL